MECYGCTMDSNQTQLRQRLHQVADRQRSLLSDFTEALTAGDHATQTAIEPKLRKSQAELQRLSDELRYTRLEQNVAAPRTHARMTGKTVRERALDAIDEIGVPVSPSTVSDFCHATTGFSIPASRFASLRRDEERAWRRDPASRPAWIAPALSTAHLTALPRLFTSSTWELERRLVGGRSARVNHLHITLAFLDRFERLLVADESQARVLENLLIRFARGVPGATSTGEALDGPRIRDVVQSELQAIEKDDLEERRQAAARLATHRDHERLWGLPLVIEGDAKGKRAGR